MSLIRILLEDFGDDPELEDLNKIDREEVVYSQLIEKAEKKFTFIDGGSSRKVFEYKPDTVVKVAYNAKGMAQNKAECELGQDPVADHMVAKVHYCSERRSFLISEKVTDISRVEFYNKTDMEWTVFLDFCDFIRDYHGHKKNIDMPEIVERQFNDSDWAQWFESFLLDFQLYEIMGDFKQINHWGTVDRDGKELVVLNDYGLNKEIFDKYYR